MEGIKIELTSRQLEIIALVKKNEPITGEHIAERLGISRPTIRSDLSVLVMLGYIDAKPKVGYFLGKTMDTTEYAAKQLRNIKVGEVQGVPVVVTETTNVHDAVVMLFLENVGSLQVVDDQGILTGIVSRKDLLKFTLGNQEASKTPVGLVMTRQPNIITVTPEDSVFEAARKMIKHQVDGLPVVKVQKEQEQGQGKVEVVGRITKTTMTQLLLDLTKGT